MNQTPKSNQERTMMHDDADDGMQHFDAIEPLGVMIVTQAGGR
jgi:hypothetical protein